jgi:hypothetical protein
LPDIFFVDLILIAISPKIKSTSCPAVDHLAGVRSEEGTDTAKHLNNKKTLSIGEGFYLGAAEQD